MTFLITSTTKTKEDSNSSLHLDEEKKMRFGSLMAFSQIVTDTDTFHQKKQNHDIKKNKNDDDILQARSLVQQHHQIILNIGQLQTKHLTSNLEKLENSFQSLQDRNDFFDAFKIQALLIQLTSLQQEVNAALTALQSSRQVVFNSVVMSFRQKNPFLKADYILFRQSYHLVCNAILDITHRIAAITSSLELVFFFENDKHKQTQTQFKSKSKPRPKRKRKQKEQSEIVFDRSIDQ
jgi:hypothetical protein